MLTELEPSFLIHTRPYRDTSMLVEAFTRQYGRVTLVARGVKGKKGHKTLLQPFAPLLMSWWLKGDLGTVRSTELYQQPFWLTGNRLVSGLYANELLNRLLQRHEAHSELFDYYAATIRQIAHVELNQLPVILRLFEKHLMVHLGYGLVFNRDAFSGEPIEPDKHYSFDPLIGCYICRGDWGGYAARHLYKGSTLLALHTEQFTTAEELNESKRLMRTALSSHLGEKPLLSRSLWRRDVSGSTIEKSEGSEPDDTIRR